MSYYRLTTVDVGKTGVIPPTGYYEAISEEGDIKVVRWIGNQPFFTKSEVLETCFSKKPHLCLLSVAALLKPAVYHLYETNETPEINLCDSKLDYYIDCAYTQEVRFRRSVFVKKVTSISLNEQEIQAIQAIQDEFCRRFFQGSKMHGKIETLKRFLHESVTK